MRDAIKPYSVSCVAAGQMDFSTVHEFIDDEIANNCLSSSRCRNILLHHQLRHNVPLSFFFFFFFSFSLSNENRCRLFPNETGASLTQQDKTSASVWCSPPLVAVATVISPASSWPQSHLGAPPSLSQGAFQWGGYCGGMVADCLSIFFFFSFACMWLLCLGPERESLLQWMEVNEAGTSSEWQIVSQCLFYPDDFKGLKTPVATETHKSSATAANSPSFSSLFHRCHHIKAHSQLLDTNEDA